MQKKTKIILMVLAVILFLAIIYAILSSQGIIFNQQAEPAVRVEIIG